MTEPEVFVLADEAMVTVVNQIKDDQWQMEMGPEFAVRHDHSRAWTLRDVINYHAYDDAWVPDMLAGKTMEEAGKDKYDGDLLKDDPKGNFSAIAQSAIAAARAVTNLDQIVHCSFGDYKVREYFWQINMFRAIRAHELATVLGIPSPLSAELAQGLYDEMLPIAEEWRKIGVFKPEVQVPPDASIQNKFLALTGRQSNFPN